MNRVILTESNAEDDVMSSTNVKQAAHELLDSFPESVTWDEVVYRMEVRASIERGLKDVQEGRVESQEAVKQRFGIDG